MAYTKNPKMGKVRREAVLLVKKKGWSTREVARYTGYAQGTIVKWCQRDKSGGLHELPTRSSKPKTSPKALPQEVVSAIIEKRQGRRRCGQVIHQELLRDGVDVSLSSVQRTLDRCGLTKKRSPWKRPHDHTPRPTVANVGDLVEIDTIHIILPDSSRLYVYTLIDLYSRFAYAEPAPRIGAQPSIDFVRRARKRFPFPIHLIQSDHGSEFSTWFTHALQRMNITHRHARVRQKNDQAHIERFNRTIQEECLDRIPNTLSSFQKAIPTFINYYNSDRLHIGLNFKTPAEVIPSY